MIRPAAPALAALSALLLAACGSDTTDISQPVDRINQGFLSGANARLDCPGEVSGGEGATFTCTLRSTRNGRAAPVSMRVAKRGDETAVDFADPGQFGRALRSVGSR